MWFLVTRFCAHFAVIIAVLMISESVLGQLSQMERASITVFVGLVMMPLIYRPWFNRNFEDEGEE
jgi:hypothetical protein